MCGSSDVVLWGLYSQVQPLVSTCLSHIDRGKYISFPVIDLTFRQINDQ